MSASEPAMIHVHFVVSNLDVGHGGMQQSAVRIVNHLSSRPGITVTLYTFRKASPAVLSAVATPVVSLYRQYLKLTKPHQRIPVPLEDRHRLHYLLLRHQMASVLAREPQQRHVIVSFFSSSTSVTAQHVAIDLKLPHIASFRGSDINRDLYSYLRYAGIAFVVDRADRITVTCNSHRDSLVQRFGREHAIRTIYNSMPDVGSLAASVTPPPDVVKVFADCGYDFKKATHLLVEAISELRQVGVPVALTIAGRDDPDTKTFWEGFRRKWSLADKAITFLPECSKAEVLHELSTSHIYCSPSLGEGCSNSTLAALALGIPIVATDVGCLAELTDGISHVRLCIPGNESDLVTKLREVSGKLLAGRLEIDWAIVARLKAELAPETEADLWASLIQEVLRRRPIAPTVQQKRVLFFVHDGIGLGHLQRLSRLAEVLQGPCSCLFLTGHRNADWMVPAGCEFIHLPSLDSLLPGKAKYWRREPFLYVDPSEAYRLRASIMAATVNAFTPDAIVVDYLPLGKNNELEEMIRTSPALKYFVLRGILDSPENVRKDILTPAGESALRNYYDRIVVACDPRICDVLQEYELPAEIVTKISYIGYVCPQVDAATIARARAERGVGAHEKWVVCSAGGGALGERLIKECARIARSLPNVRFDLCHGPRGGHKWGSVISDQCDVSNMRVHRISHYLGTLHAACDVVVCTGAYNSVVEGLTGNAHILCVPAQLHMNDEQFVHPERLGKLSSRVKIVQNYAELEKALACALEADCAKLADSELQMDGAARFRNALFEDLGMMIATPEMRMA